MKRILLTVTVVVLTGLSATPGIAQRDRNRSAAQRGWQSNYREALATARRLDKPLMVVFRCVP